LGGSAQLFDLLGDPIAQEKKRKQMRHPRQRK
jgi:hypothetical protein